MNAQDQSRNSGGRRRRMLLAVALLLSTLPLHGTTQSRPAPTVARWGRFDVEFTSTKGYRDPLHDVRVIAELAAPNGARLKTEAFWDGANTWRLRFAPGELGEWSYRTTCTDASNRGLHNRSGRFLCTAPKSGSRFAEHGPVQVAGDGFHFEHADHTPFLWLGDAAWESMRTITVKAVQNLATQRATEGFTAVHCALWPGKDSEGDGVFVGKERLVINLSFCRRLDAKIESLNKAGLLVALSPLPEIGVAPAQLLPEDQAVAFFRYAVLRWGAESVAWVVAIESERVGARVSRWQRLGREVFSGTVHGPVIFWPGESSWLFDEFRREAWVDALGYSTVHAASDDGLQWLFTGPLASEWRKLPARPLLNLGPPKPTGKELDIEFARRLFWWSVLLQPVAGTSWNTEGGPSADTRFVTYAGGLLEGVQSWRLRPMPQVVVRQSGLQSPRRRILAAGSDLHDLLLVYVPEDRAFELANAALPREPVVVWFNPRTGGTGPARFTVDGGTAKFTSPGAGDWLLVARAAR